MQILCVRFRSKAGEIPVVRIASWICSWPTIVHCDSSLSRKFLKQEFVLLSYTDELELQN